MHNLPQNHLPIGIQTYKNENQDSKCKQRRAAIADQWQWDANNRC